MHLPDLLPFPFTEEALRVVTRNLHCVQEALKREILVENPSRYLSVPESELTEAQFMAELVLRSGCGVLLDLNNLHVSACNDKSDSAIGLVDFLDTVPTESIRKIHLAGHTLCRLDCVPSLYDCQSRANVANTYIRRSHYSAPAVQPRKCDEAGPRCNSQRVRPWAAFGMTSELPRSPPARPGRSFQARESPTRGRCRPP